jgi:hypothetical protein
MGPFISYRKTRISQLKSQQIATVCKVGDLEVFPKPFWIWKHIHAHKVHVYEVYAHEVRAYELHAHKVHTHEVHAREVHAHEMHAREMYAHEVYACGIHVH